MALARLCALNLSEENIACQNRSINYSQKAEKTKILVHFNGKQILNWPVEKKMGNGLNFFAIFPENLKI